MIYLIQILRMLRHTQDIDHFYDIFEDISDVTELGYSESEAIETLLDSHFNIQMECLDQLQMLTNLIVSKPKSLKAAINLEKIRRN
jgi:hypothetical protein